jgi:U4/U6.U5 tri-snRNP-associated protein 2
MIPSSAPLLQHRSSNVKADEHTSRIMAAVSEPASPPAAKRARLDPDTQFSTLPPSPQNGHSDANGATSSTAHMPTVTSAPDLPVADPTKGNEDYESDEEDVPEQPVAEEEDLSRADMYLDTVCLFKQGAGRG